jgi:SNF2 family DNA or RNA helicase
MEEPMGGLWQHQRDALAYAKTRRDVILHCGMGTGKSRMAIEIILDLLTQKPGARILLGCPKAVMAAWAKQMKAWAPSLRVIVLDKGSSAQKDDIVKAAMADLSPCVIVGNYETLFRMKSLVGIAWDCLVWDEAHRLKSPSGATSKWASKVATKNPTAKRIALSGTLLAHSPLDAFGVYRAVESPECPTFGQWYTPFKARYAIENPRIRGMVVGYRNQDDFAEKLAATTFHRRSEDVLDLPPIMFEDIAVELGPKEARLYLEIEKEFCAVLETGTITPKNAMENVLRLAQITGGYVKLDDAESPTPIEEHPSKRAALTEWLEDLDAAEPVVIFCRFRTDIDSAIHACKATGRSVSELSGRMDNLAEWQAGETAVLVAQIQSGGIGVDLTRASYGVFFSLGYSLSEYLQAVARLHRPGQTRTTRFYHLVATLARGVSTVDGRIYKALSERKEVIDELVIGYRAGHSAGRSSGSALADR